LCLEDEPACTDLNLYSSNKYTHGTHKHRINRGKCEIAVQCKWWSCFTDSYSSADSV